MSTKSTIKYALCDPMLLNVKIFNYMNIYDNFNLYLLAS